MLHAIYQWSSNVKRVLALLYYSKDEEFELQPWPQQFKLDARRHVASYWNRTDI